MLRGNPWVAYALAAQRNRWTGRGLMASVLGRTRARPDVDAAVGADVVVPGRAGSDGGPGMTAEAALEVLALSTYRHAFGATLNGDERATLDRRCRELVGLPERAPGTRPPPPFATEDLR